jgi:RNA polymerase sigma factor (TIGR02999 family)
MAGKVVGEVTAVLRDIQSGSAEAKSRLVDLLFENYQRDIHEIAAALMRQERSGHTLQPTALMHEAFLRVVTDDALQDAPSRQYVFEALRKAMRRILVEHARGRKAQKRGGDQQRVPLDGILDYFEEQNLDIVALNEALNELASLNPRHVQVVECRFLCDMTMPQIAEHLHVSLSTVESDWRLARAWLRKRIRGSTDDS